MDRRGILLGSAGLGTLLFGLPLRPAPAQQATAPRRLSGSEYLAAALMGGTLAKQTSQLALERAQHPKVKQFAGFEVAEQTVLAQVLTDTENPPPVPLDANHAAALRTLQEQQAGPAFDRAYVLSQIQQHQALLLVQQGYLESFNRRTDTQHIAMLARVSIQQHLVMLQEIQAMLT
jgi:putative membrane protein